MVRSLTIVLMALCCVLCRGEEPGEPGLARAELEESASSLRGSGEQMRHRGAQRKRLGRSEGLRPLQDHKHHES